MDQNEFHNLVLQIAGTDNQIKNAAEQRYMQFKNQADPRTFMQLMLHECQTISPAQQMCWVLLKQDIEKNTTASVAAKAQENYLPELLQLLAANPQLILTVVVSAYVNTMLVMHPDYDVQLLL